MYILNIFIYIYTCILFMYAYVYIYIIIYYIYTSYVYIIPSTCWSFLHLFSPASQSRAMLRPLSSHARGRPPWKKGTVRSKTWGHRELSSARFVFFFPKRWLTLKRRVVLFFSHHWCPKGSPGWMCVFFGYSILYGRLVNISGFKATPNFVGSFADVVTFVTFESLRTLRWAPKFVIEKVLELIPIENTTGHMIWGFHTSPVFFVFSEFLPNIRILSLHDGMNTEEWEYDHPKRFRTIVSNLQV